jgi:uncharacterized protein YcfJ
MSIGKVIAPLLLLPSVAFAGTSYFSAPVVGVDPVYEVVTHSVPREQCYERDVAYRQPTYARSVTAPIVGAIIGGAIGNAVGHHKRNKQVGTVVGALLGGSIGADVARRHRYRNARLSYRTEEVCSIVEEFREEERLAGYDVTYRYGAGTYTTRMRHHPGDSIRVKVRVTPVS